jgi:hypothetical protein
MESGLQISAVVHRLPEIKSGLQGPLLSCLYKTLSLVTKSRMDGLLGCMISHKYYTELGEKQW